MNHLCLRHHAARQLHVSARPIILIFPSHLSRHNQYRRLFRHSSTSSQSADLTTTRPAPLDLPTPPNDHAWPSLQSKNPIKWDYSYLFRLGKAYGKFFWTGVKNVYANYKTSSSIKQRLNDPFSRAIRSNPPSITYSEYELLLRTRRDLKKLLPFGLIFIICGEFTPLVILAFGSAIVPATCVIPKQIAQDQQKMQQREQRYMLHVAENWARYSSSQANNSISNSEKGPSVSDSSTSHPASNSVQQSQIQQSPVQQQTTEPELFRLGLTSSFQPILFSIRSGRFLSKLQRQCLELLNTAKLVQHEGGWSQKSPQDMWEWGNKYGMYSLRTYADATIANGDNPISETMKEKLLPIFEQETKQMLEFAEKCNENERWMAGYHSWSLFPDRPDCAAQRKDLEVLAQKQTQKIESEAVLKQGDAVKKPE